MMVVMEMEMAVEMEMAWHTKSIEKYEMGQQRGRKVFQPCCLCFLRNELQEEPDIPTVGFLDCKRWELG